MSGDSTLYVSALHIQSPNVPQRLSGLSSWHDTFPEKAASCLASYAWLIALSLPSPGQASLDYFAD